MDKFPYEMEKIGINVNEVLAKSYQIRVRRRATGRLKKIEIVPRGKLSILVEYPDEETSKIAKFVNDGSFPNHPIPSQLMEASRAGRKTAGRKSRSVLGELTNPHFVQPRASASKGFLTKSMETLKKDMPALIEGKIQEAFNAM